MKMKIFKNKIVAAILLAGLMACSLAGCGKSSGKASDYVDAILHIAYFSDAIDNKTLDMTDDEVRKARQDCADKEAQFLAGYFNMEDISDNTREIFKETAEKLLAKADYTVSEGEGSKVKVSIKPLIVYSEELQEFVDDFNVKKYVDADKSCTEEKFAEGVAGFLEKSADNAKYADEIEVEVNVTENNGKYEISDEDLSKIDAAMFVYD